MPAEVWPIDVFHEDFETARLFASALIFWCRGFLRATTEWPDAWGDTLMREDLAPHWALVRAWADPEAPGNTKVIEDAGRRETPGARGQALPQAVVALYRALRPAGANPL